MDNFTHLHVHSQYSLLDGLDSPETLVVAAKDLGQTAIAITDHGTLSGHRELQEACAKHGIKPLLGIEAYVSATDRFDKRSVKKRDDNTQVYNHMNLIAQNQQGLDNINTLSKIAWTEGFYYKPRMDKEILSQHSEGIIALSGCFNGIASKAIERGDLEEAQEYLLWMKEVFGENAYVEVQPHNDDYINLALLKYADEFGIRAVATGDCHYASPDDRALEDAYLVLSTNPKRSDEPTTADMDLLEKLNTLYPDRFMTFKDIDVFVGSRMHIKDGMLKHGIDREDIYDNTMRIADSVGEFEYHKGLDLLPSEFADPVSELEDRVLTGLRKYGKHTDPVYLDRVAEEMRVIRKKNFAPYFLVVDGIIKFAESEGILVGAGRGSAAGSLICYALGITQIDPIKYNLLFARFINEERNDFPDIDMDFEDARRVEVKHYLEREYGYVASIATFSYFKDKGVIKDAARVLGVPYGETNKAMKYVADWEDFVRSRNDTVARFRDKHPDVVALAAQLRGRIRSQGMHAGGVVVANEPIERYAPIESTDDPQDRTGDRIPVAAYDMEKLEDIGLIKFDILGLSTLTVMHNAMDLILDRHGVLIEPQDIPLDDDNVYKQLAAGNTVGVFQAEAAPYTKLLQDMHPTEFNHLVASNALVRPGAMNTVGPAFLRRMHGKEAVDYIHPSVQQYLEDTYGVVIYQEQVMQLAVELGEFTWSEADKLRKIIGKKKDVHEFDQYRDKFIKNASKRIKPKEAAQLWHDFEAHAGYSFNKSHAVAYSVLSYQTAWLKYHYPVEYMTALLRTAQGDKDKVTRYIIEAQRLGVTLVDPDVNDSDYEFQITADGIQFGLSNIKYISEKVASKIIAGRPYSTYEEFLDTARAKYSGINTRAVEALRVTGGLTSIGMPPQGDEYLENLYEYLRVPEFGDVKLHADGEALICDAVDFDEEDGPKLYRVQCKKMRREKNWSLAEFVDATGDFAVFSKPDISIEKDDLYYVVTSGKNILAHIRAADVVDQNNALAVLLMNSHQPLLDATGGYVVQFKERTTKAGNQMGNLLIYNPQTGFVDLVVWSDKVDRVRRIAKPGQIVKVSGKKNKRGGITLKDITK